MKNQIPLNSNIIFVTDWEGYAKAKFINFSKVYIIDNRSIKLDILQGVFSNIKKEYLFYEQSSFQLDNYLNILKACNFTNSSRPINYQKYLLLYQSIEIFHQCYINDKNFEMNFNTTITKPLIKIQYMNLLNNKISQYCEEDIVYSDKEGMFYYTAKFIAQLNFYRKINQYGDRSDDILDLAAGAIDEIIYKLLNLEKECLNKFNQLIYLLIKTDDTEQNKEGVDLFNHIHQSVYNLLNNFIEMKKCKMSALVYLYQQIPDEIIIQRPNTLDQKETKLAIIKEIPAWKKAEVMDKLNFISRQLIIADQYQGDYSIWYHEYEECRVLYKDNVESFFKFLKRDSTNHESLINNIIFNIENKQFTAIEEREVLKLLHKEIVRYNKSKYNIIFSIQKCAQYLSDLQIKIYEDLNSMNQKRFESVEIAHEILGCIKEDLNNIYVSFRQEDV